MSQLFTWGGQSIGVSASVSVLPMNTQDWSPLYFIVNMTWKFQYLKYRNLVLCRVIWKFHLLSYLLPVHCDQGKLLSFMLCIIQLGCAVLCCAKSFQSCPTLCDPMSRSTPDLPVHHQLPEFTQTHVYRVSDAIQPSHPLSSPSPPAPNPSQHQSLFMGWHLWGHTELDMTEVT